MDTWKMKATFTFLLLLGAFSIIITMQQISWETIIPRLKQLGRKQAFEARNLSSQGRGVTSFLVEGGPSTVVTPMGLRKMSKHNQSFVLSPVFNFHTTCDTSCNIRKSWQWTMVTFIKSSADSFDRRSFIRRTWGNIRYTESGRFLFVFVTGRPKSKATFSLVQEEWEKNQDILMYDGPDDYRNVVWKTLAGMQWASEKLDRDFFYSSADDDILLDIAKLQVTVTETIKQVDSFKWPKFPFVCIYLFSRDTWVHRDKDSKYYVSYNDYSPAKYPGFCYGGFYTTSVETIAQVWNISRNYHALPMDDAWITGILREKLEMRQYTVVDPTTVKHFEGFKDKGDLKSKTFMAEEWAEFYQEISELPHCLCQ